MYIESVPNRNSPPAILLRESYRDADKIKKRTIANLSDWPTEIVEGLRTLLKGGKVAPADQESIIVRRALPHGHVAAVLGTLRNIGLDRMLGPPRNRCRDLVIAMIVARLIAPASKLATARMLDPLTASSSLGEVLSLGPVDEDELYVALDWLGERQEAIEKAIARKHLHDGTLVLYDVSSSYVEGRCCELARLGYNRDGKKGKLQIVYGLLCAADGCPVAIEVFEGDTGDPRTLAAQIDKVKKRFALERVALVGDRGMITQARLDAEIAPAGLDWITALRAPAIRTLVEAGALQMSLFDQRDMAAITSPDYPGERLIVCRNPDLARERTRKREDLLAATEADLAVIAAAVRRARSPLRGEAEIALKVGAVVNRHKVAKHFELSIGEASFSFHRKTEAITAEAALDGIYVVRTNLPKKLLDDAATVGAYKSLARVERAFRSLKTVDIHLRPIFHWTTPRVRAHVLLCMLAYHVETTCAPGLRRCCTTRPITRLPPPCALPSLPRPSAPKPPGASRPPASPTTACRCTAFKACLPTSPPMRGSRRPPRSTINTSSRSTPGQLRSSSAPSSSSPSTRIVPSKATRARDKQQRVHCLIDSKEGSSVRR